MTLSVAVLEPGYADYEAENAVLQAVGARVVPVRADEDAASALKQINPVGVMVRERAVTRREMDCCRDLKVVVRYGVGVDNIDLKTAGAREIYVANVPDYGAEHEVSEHAVALYLSVQRRIVPRDAEVRAGGWGVGQAQPIPGRVGATLGLVGYGRIGQAAAAKFQALGFARILVVDPTASEEDLAANNAERVSIDALCRDADVISLHAPLVRQTRHIVNAERLALMKPSTILVNVSRGGLVDEDALAEALIEGRIFGAGIDVFEQEPPASKNPLMHAPNTVLSDHTGWYSERSVSVLQTHAADEVRRVLSGGRPMNWVNPWTA